MTRGQCVAVGCLEGRRRSAPGFGGALLAGLSTAQLLFPDLVLAAALQMPQGDSGDTELPHIACRAPGSTTDCDCLTWTCTYNMRDLHCGQANELFVGHHGNLDPVFRQEAVVELGDKFCGLFYERLKTSFCFNMGMHYLENRPEGGQWCLVDGRCKHVNGGGQVSDDGKTKWKYCRSQGDGNGTVSDQMSRDRDPAELARMARFVHLDLSVLLKMSYPTWMENLWHDVAKYWEEGNKTLSLDTITRYRMQEVVDTGRPMIFDIQPNAGQDITPKEYYVVWRYDKVWKVQPSKRKLKSNPGTWFELVCQQGCEELDDEDVDE